MSSVLDTNISGGFARLLFFSSYFATDDTILVLRAANFTADLRGEVRFAGNVRYWSRSFKHRLIAQHPPAAGSNWFVPPRGLNLTTDLHFM